MAEKTFNEWYEELNRLYEGVSPDNPYLAKALMLYKNDKDAQGVVVSYRDKNTGKEVEVCRTYHNQHELDQMNKEFESSNDISAIHNRGNISYYENELMKKEKQNNSTAKPEVNNTDNAQVKKSKYSAAQLTNMRKNNNKIVNAAKEAGMDITPLVATGTDKNGRQFKKASPELN